MKKRILSGMRPTGKLHLGHFMGVLANYVRLQDEYDCYFMVADMHALTTKWNESGPIREYRREMVLDWLGAGIDPRGRRCSVSPTFPSTPTCSRCWPW